MGSTAKLAAVVTLLALASAATGSSLARRAGEKRFVLDTLTDLVGNVADTLDDAVHVLVDPVLQTANALLAEFNHLTEGEADMHTVVCRLPSETVGTRAERIEKCSVQCVQDATNYLGAASPYAPSACPLACQYAYDHPNAVTC